jgi:phosphoribosyl-dephospho-CoA transferase
MLKGHFDQKGHKFVIGTIESSNRQCILCGQEGIYCQSEVNNFFEISKDIL